MEQGTSQTHFPLLCVSSPVFSSPCIDLPVFPASCCTASCSLLKVSLHQDAEYDGRCGGEHKPRGFTNAESSSSGIHGQLHAEYSAGLEWCVVITGSSLLSHDCHGHYHYELYCSTASCDATHSVHVGRIADAGLKEMFGIGQRLPRPMRWPDFEPKHHLFMSSRYEHTSCVDHQWQPHFATKCRAD